MAFEQQLEADRIDDFNLFSAFVRVPLLILEGVLGQQETKDETKERLDENCERSTLPKSSSERKPQNENGGSPNSPSRIVSDEDLMSPQGFRKPLGRVTSNLGRKSSHTSFTDLLGTNVPKKTRKTSFSDESGLSLCEYHDESIKHEPYSPYHNATSTKAPVIKSAMKRSRSIRNQSLDSEKRYIPNMNQGGAAKGIAMLTRPYPGKDGTPPAGEFSPQWGWYTSLTPPDVMYSGGAKNHHQHHKRSQSEPVPRMPIPEQPAIIQDEHQANQVFQSLQNSQAPVAWTSVPI
jgi:hypothetical protein